MLAQDETLPLLIDPSKPLRSVHVLSMKGPFWKWLQAVGLTIAVVVVAFLLYCGFVILAILTSQSEIKDLTPPEIDPAFQLQRQSGREKRPSLTFPAAELPNQRSKRARSLR